MNLKHWIFFLIVICGNSGLGAQTVDFISESNLRNHVTFLSSDSLKGRILAENSPGLDMAAKYIRQNLKKNEVKPGIVDYFQAVKMVVGKSGDSKSGIAFTQNKRKTLFQTDSAILFPNVKKSAIFNGDLIYAGFGWVDKESGYNDLENLKLKNKIVLISMGTPTSFKEESGGKKPSFNYSLELEKATNILKRGARGVVLVFSPFDDGSLFKRIQSQTSELAYSFATEKKQNSFSNIIITPAPVVDRLTGGPGTIRKYIGNFMKDPVTVNTMAGISASVSIPYNEKEIPQKNVIAFIEGSDPVLKNECVVYMAHYDHLGVDKSGDVYNGADDNASGCAVLLELSRKFQSLEQKPKRSLVFLWVTGEEAGMFGSRYYTANPVFPLDKTLACINLDMAGRVFEPRDTVWKSSPKMVKDFDGIFVLSGTENPWLVDLNDQACSKLGLIPDKSLPSNFLRSSDHYQFYSKGVPILNYSTGYHADYHKPSDEISKINFQKMKRVADLCFEVGFQVANLPVTPSKLNAKP